MRSIYLYFSLIQINLLNTVLLIMVRRSAVSSQQRVSVPFFRVLVSVRMLLPDQLFRPALAADFNFAPELNC
jgi:hypothetical protein